VVTLVAYRFIVGDLVPQISYLTHLDDFLLGATLLVFASLIQSVGTTMLLRSRRLRTARQIDLWCRGLFPVLFAVVVLHPFIL
jgi:hypothetical protein